MVAGCRPERTLMGCRSTPSVFSSRLSVAKGGFDQKRTPGCKPKTSRVPSCMLQTFAPSDPLPCLHHSSFPWENRRENNNTHQIYISSCTKLHELQSIAAPRTRTGMGVLELQREHVRLTSGEHKPEVARPARNWHFDPGAFKLTA